MTRGADIDSKGYELVKILDEPVYLGQMAEDMSTTNEIRSVFMAKGAADTSVSAIIVTLYMHVYQHKLGSYKSCMFMGPTHFRSRRPN